MVLAVQIAMAFALFIVVFFVLFATRDILLRTNSFLLQMFCILLVALLPILGFFLYLLVRPSQTLAEKAMRHDIALLLSRQNAQHHKPKHHKS